MAVWREMSYDLNALFQRVLRERQFRVSGRQTLEIIQNFKPSYDEDLHSILNYSEFIKPLVLNNGMVLIWDRKGYGTLYKQKESFIESLLAASA